MTNSTSPNILFLLIVPICIQGQSLNWAHTIGGTSVDYGHAITNDPDENVIVVGYYGSTVDFDPGPNILELESNFGSGLFVQKFDSSGHLLWVIDIKGTMGQPWGPSVRPREAITDDVGNIYVVGVMLGTVDFDPGVDTFLLSSPEKSKGFILKLSGNGELEWASLLEGPGDTDNFALAGDGSLNIYLSGGFSGTIDFDPGVTEHFITSDSDDLQTYVLNLGSNGEFKWVWTSKGGGSKRPRELNYRHGEGLILNGNFSDTLIYSNKGSDTMLISNGISDGFLLKLDQSGNVEWGFAFGSDESDIAISTAIDSEGNVYLLETYQLTIDVDPGPGVYPLTSHGMRDILILKLSSSGEFIWAKRIGSVDNENGHEIAINGQNEPIIVGQFHNSVDLDPGPGEDLHTSLNAESTFIIALDQIGNYKWGRSFTSPEASQGHIHCHSYSVLESPVVYMTGWFSDTVDFDPGPQTEIHATDNFLNTDFFVLKFIYESVSAINETELANFNIFPNPNSGFICWKDLPSGNFKQVCVFDLSGRLLKEKSLEHAKSDQLRLPEQPGVYYIIFRGAERQKVFKVIRY